MFTRPGTVAYGAPFPLLPGSKSTDGGVVALSVNDTTKAVTFGLNFTAAPTVVGQIILANGSASGITCWPDESTRTVLGVTFLFSAPIQESGCKLAWTAIGS